MCNLKLQKRIPQHTVQKFYIRTQNQQQQTTFIIFLSDSLLYLFITFGPNQLNNFYLQMFTSPREQRAITPGTSSEDSIVSD